MKTVLEGDIYRQRIVPGGGLSAVKGAKAKVVFHSTQTPPGSADTIISKWWRDLGQGMPQFFGNRPDDIVQTLPLNVNAYTLQNPDGGIDTNRGGEWVIQIEICDYAENAIVYTTQSKACGRRDGDPGWGLAGSPWMRALARFLADLVDAGLELDLENHIDWGNANRPRISSAAWYAFNSACGHRDAPEQPGGHWDPGPIDGAWCLAEARRIRAARNGGATPDTGTTVPPPSEEDDDMVKNCPSFQHGNDWYWYSPSGAFKKVEGPSALTVLKAKGVIDPAPTLIDGKTLDELIKSS